MSNGEKELVITDYTEKSQCVKYAKTLSVEEI